MQTLETGTNPAKQAGFSLLEALMALIVVGLVASAVLVVAPGREGATRAAAERLAVRLDAARDQSVIRNRAIALVVTPEGAGFVERASSGWRQITDGSPLAFRPWPRGVAAQASEEGPYAIRFDALGQAIPGEVVFTGGGEVQWRARVDGAGRVYVERIG